MQAVQLGIVLQHWAKFAEPEARPDIRLFARLAIMPKEQPAARMRIPMMVMGDSDLIVMVVSERNDHHDRSEATLTL